jgi:hypothetical protein
MSQAGANPPSLSMRIISLSDSLKFIAADSQICQGHMKVNRAHFYFDRTGAVNDQQSE